MPQDDLSSWDPYGGVPQPIGSIGKAEPRNRAARRVGPVRGPTDPDVSPKPNGNGKKAEDNTVWWVVGGIGVVTMVGIGIALAVNKPKRRRRRRRR